MPLWYIGGVQRMCRELDNKSKIEYAQPMNIGVSCNNAIHVMLKYYKT